MSTQKRIIAHGLFTYSDGVAERIAFRGDEVELSAAEAKRGDLLGAFVTDEPEPEPVPTVTELQATVEDLTAEAAATKAELEKANARIAELEQQLVAKPKQ